MHPHAQLITRLYKSLGEHDHDAMAECYHPHATFRDIAFDLKGRGPIHDMWRFVTRPEPHLTVSFAIVSADDDHVEARLTDRYVFTDTGRPVDNAITSTFHFRDGLIVEHRDDCDPVSWARMAMSGPKAWLAGHLRPVRAFAAHRKLRAFTRQSATEASPSRG